MRKKAFSSETKPSQDVRYSGESRPIRRKLFATEEEEELYLFLRGGLCAK